MGGEGRAVSGDLEGFASGDLFWKVPSQGGCPEQEEYNPSARGGVLIGAY